MFFTTSLEYAYLSSSSVKEIASFGGDISLCVPDFVADMVYERYEIKPHTSAQILADRGDLK